MTTIISKVRAEIERIMCEYEPFEGGIDETTGAHIALAKLLSFLDTLEEETTYDTQQYTPRPSVGIEDVARVQFASHAKVFDKKRKAVFDWEQFKEVVGIFYGFGRGSSEKPNNHEGLDEAAEKYFLDNYPDCCWEVSKTAMEDFKAGAEWDRNQMMKEAVEGEVVQDLKGVNRVKSFSKIPEWLHFGDKVRIIIVKED